MSVPSTDTECYRPLAPSLFSFVRTEVIGLRAGGAGQTRTTKRRRTTTMTTKQGRQRAGPPQSRAWCGPK
eukprot:451419-Rhodomonas_salina.1